MLQIFLLQEKIRKDDRGQVVRQELHDSVAIARDVCPAWSVIRRQLYDHFEHFNKHPLFLLCGITLQGNRGAKA